MGTRADFYVGRGKEAEWLGSVTHDGHPDRSITPVLQATSEASYRAAVAALFAERQGDATLASEGWPWPWENSCTTDYSYAFEDGVVYAACFGRGWRTLAEIEAYNIAYAVYRAAPEGTVPEPPDLWDDSKNDYPNMKERTNKDLLIARSGLIFLVGK